MKYGGGGKTRTSDLQLMRLASCRLLYPTTEKRPRFLGALFWTMAILRISGLASTGDCWVWLWGLNWLL